MTLVEYALVFGTALLPAFIWLIFFTREDIHPEPKRLVMVTFFSGALITLPVLLVQIQYQQLITYAPFFIFASVIGLAIIEEVFKFFAAFGSIHNHPDFDEPVDAMIYSIAAALGFATVENIFVTLNTLDTLTTFSFPTIAETLLLRFLGATLLHALASSIAGYYWARGLQKRKLFNSLIAGLFWASAVHAIFNLLILRFQHENIFYPSVFLVCAGFFVLKDFEQLKINTRAWLSNTSQQYRPITTEKQQSS